MSLILLKWFIKSRHTTCSSQLECFILAILKFVYDIDLFQVTGLHDSWRVSKWSKLYKGSKLFHLDESLGQIRVPQTGLYLVYAQVG